MPALIKNERKISWADKHEYPMKNLIKFSKTILELRNAEAQKPRKP
jgi:hypothetical protein